MAVYSSDGVGHHSAGRAKMHDEIKASKPKPAAAPTGDKRAAPRDEAPSPHSIEDHVAEHGPAVEMHHRHDKATGKHHVTSHHGEGGSQKHTSEHETPEDAMERMKKAMGLAETPDSDQTEMDITPEQEAAESRTGGGIQGMA